MALNDWHPCYYNHETLSLVPELIDGKWYEWLSKDGQIQEARYKADLQDHFWPHPPLFAMEDAIAYRELIRKE